METREDGTIETALPLPAPFAGCSSGATPFTPSHFIDAPPPEWPRSLVKVSPRPLPRKTGLKGGVPFSPLDLISQFVPVPLPFIANIFFPGSPETIDSFFHLLLHNGVKSFLKEHSDKLYTCISQLPPIVKYVLRYNEIVIKVQKLNWKQFEM